MIRGIGIDVVKVERLEQAVERWGQRFLERIFTSDEINRCQQRMRSAHCLALRFAAKEAFAKALGIGMQKGLRWRDIEVVNDHLGKPELLLHNQAKILSRNLAVEKIWLSLSDESGFAIAMVVLEG